MKVVFMMEVFYTKKVMIFFYHLKVLNLRPPYLRMVILSWLHIFHIHPS